MNRQIPQWTDLLGRSVLLALLNAPVVLIWALPGDHGQRDDIVYGTIILTAILFLGAIVALALRKHRLALALGFAAPVTLFAYWAFFTLLGIFLGLRH